jgi:hypothetical protein
MYSGRKSERKSEICSKYYRAFYVCYYFAGNKNEGAAKSYNVAVTVCRSVPRILAVSYLNF